MHTKVFFIGCLFMLLQFSIEGCVHSDDREENTLSALEKTKKAKIDTRTNMITKTLLSDISNESVKTRAEKTRKIVENALGEKISIENQRMVTLYAQICVFFYEDLRDEPVLLEETVSKLSSTLKKTTAQEKKEKLKEEYVRLVISIESYRMQKLALDVANGSIDLEKAKNDMQTMELEFDDFCVYWNSMITKKSFWANRRRTIKGFTLDATCIKEYPFCVYISEQLYYELEKLREKLISRGEKVNKHKLNEIEKLINNSKRYGLD